MLRHLFCIFLAATLATSASRISHAADRADILIADFESDDYGQWAVTGNAFGPGPAHGTLPNQMAVSGFQGERLVNSFFQGDGSTGTLTSPPFQIERTFINFLIGGGGYANETCVHLIVEGKTVRTETGPNNRPGGSERLDWATWNVEELNGKEAMLQIIDARTGGWGHINVDQIVQSDRKLQAEPARKEFFAEHRYLLLPVKTGETVRRARLEVDGQTVREFEIELAESQPQFLAFVDLLPFRQKTIQFVVDRLPKDSKALELVRTVNELPPEAGSYLESARPGLHFTSRVGWLNDPNGLVHHDGQWHLFYQHNPYGWNWGNMHWGHAVSSDLLHWKELPIAIYPKQFGDWAFSGSAVIDSQDTSGWKCGSASPMVAAFTSTGRGECITYSCDGGSTWTEYEGNPVVKHQGRDPRLLWHEPSKHWVMAVYDELDNKKWIAFYTSPDLKKWTYRSRIEGFYECPDLLEVPIQGSTESMWVLYGADGKYLLGDFDGQMFRPKSDKLTLWHGNFYAAQSFTNAPDGRCVQIGWGNGITFPGQPFNQQMTIPCELSLRSTPTGIRMYAWPVKEILQLRHGQNVRVADATLNPGQTLNGKLPAELCDGSVEIAWSQPVRFTVNIRGMPLMYDSLKRELTALGRTMPLDADENKLRLRFLIDRGSLEIFANEGELAVSLGIQPADRPLQWSVASKHGAAHLVSAEFHPLKSVHP